MNKTAAELLAELSTDFSYRRKRELREEDLARSAAESAQDEAELVAELRILGFAVNSVYDLVNQENSYQAAYDLLIAHLETAHLERVREGIIRALTVKDLNPRSVELLLSHFHLEENRYLRWCLANALKWAMPYSRRRKIPEIAKVWKAGCFE